MTIIRRGGFLAAVMTLAGAATAQPTADAAKADALFNSAKELMENGNFTSACPKLSESESLDPQVGTALNLAYCYENLGRTATAWSVWLQAAAAAAAKGDRVREEFATSRANALQPLLLRVTITVAPQPSRESIELAIDGAPLARTEWGLPLPLDPGEYELRATAPGFRPWFSKFMVAKNRVPTILVPELERWPAEAAFVMPSQRSSHDGSSAIPVLWATGIVGIGAVGLGTAFGIAALVNDGASNRDGNCIRDNCNPAGLSDRSRAKTDALVADVMLGGGAVTLLASAAIYVAFYPLDRPAPRVAWWAGLAPTPGIGTTGFVARSW